jgi:cyclopropane fatty-acyl-phospholipid synthase-like methyltransferase
MYESLKTWLRGDYNSIRYKYWHLPKEWLVYFFGYRIRGKKWLDYYSSRMDRCADNIFRPKQEYLEFGEFQLNYLKGVGLKPSDRFLDYGCGVMRTGIHIAKFLEAGRYTGVDISASRLANARVLMGQYGFDETDYRAIHVADCQLKELSGNEFDMVFAASVFTHMTLEDIVAALVSIKALLADGGQFLFTYAEAETRRRKNIKDFWYTRGEIENACSEAGLNFEVMDGYKVHDDLMGRCWVPHPATASA